MQTNFIRKVWKFSKVLVLTIFIAKIAKFQHRYVSFVTSFKLDCWESVYKCQIYVKYNILYFTLLWDFGLIAFTVAPSCGHFLCNKNYVTRDYSLISKLHCLAKTWIYLTPYVCNERIFDSWPFMYNKTFLKKILYKLVAHIFTLHLTPFASKLVNYSRLSESLNNRKNSKIDDIFLRWERFVDFQTYFKDSLRLE